MVRYAPPRLVLAARCRREGAPGEAIQVVVLTESSP
jgi:hypothetical protein